jgi:hypothetical protein
LAAFLVSKHAHLSSTLTALYSMSKFETLMHFTHQQQNRHQEEENEIQAVLHIGKCPLLVHLDLSLVNVAPVTI